LYRSSELRIFDKRVGDAAFALLSALGAGETLVAACEAAAATPGVDPASLEQELARWFELWGKLGWIVGVTA
jgi:hypothetical protein